MATAMSEATPQSLLTMRETILQSSHRTAEPGRGLELGMPLQITKHQWPSQALGQSIDFFVELEPGHVLVLLGDPRRGPLGTSFLMPTSPRHLGLRLRRDTAADFE
jgi:hypothetical protein